MAHSSQDSRSRRLLCNLRLLLQDVSQHPLLNTPAEQFNARIDSLRMANAIATAASADAAAAAEAASMSNANFREAVVEFLDWAQSDEVRRVGNHLYDLLAEFY